jgi:hypothetical protein
MFIWKSEFDPWVEEVATLADRLESHASTCPRCGGYVPHCKLCARVMSLALLLQEKVNCCRDHQTAARLEQQS